MMASAWQKVNATRYDHVMERKPRWRGIKDTEVQAAICDLSSLGWMQPHQGTGLLDDAVASKHAIALPLRQRRITLHEQYHQTAYTPHGSRYGAGFSISDADCFSWDTQKSTRFFKQSTISPGSSIFLRQHRIMGQGDSASVLTRAKVWKMREYWMYFPFFILHDWGKRSAEARNSHCAVLP